MAYKVHPKGYRLKRNQDWNSRWLDEKDLPQLLEEDFKIRKFLRKKLKDASLEKVEIERISGRIKIDIVTSRPGLVIGRGGKGVEKLRNALKHKILKGDQKLKLEVKRVENFWSSADLVGQWMADQIENRVSYRRVLGTALERIMSVKSVKGAKVQVQGRLNGSLIARRQWSQEGDLPRTTLRADLDYAIEEAVCTYGTIGIKVWINKGEEL